jgi:uncharacterized protein YacL (UPF0231 family)
VANIDFTAVIVGIVPTVISLGLTTWVYKVLNHIITDLKSQIKDLENKVKGLEDSENKWYRKYHELRVLVSVNRCKNRDCKVTNAMDELMAKNGEV